MKFLFILFYITISLLNIGITMAQGNQTTVHYQMMFKVNNMSCEAKLNGMYLAHTDDLTDASIPKQVSFTQSISQYMNEGKNILTLEGHNAAPYVKDPENGYCDIKIVAMAKNPVTGDVHSKDVTHIRYSYVKNEDENIPYPYVLTIENSSRDQDPLLTSPVITLQELTPYKDAKKKPIQRTLATRELMVNHPQPFSWIHRSTSFTDTPENRQKLWNKYNEIRTAIINNDKSAIRHLVEPGLTDVASFQGDDVENHFNIVFAQLLEDDFFKMDRKVWEEAKTTINDYDLEIYAEGKLFRFNMKNKTLYSPLQWFNPFTQKYRAYNPIFTYINGEIVMATF